MSQNPLKKSSPQSPKQTQIKVNRKMFLSAAQPTDQGEESVVLLLLVVVGGDHFSSSHVQFFGR